MSRYYLRFISAVTVAISALALGGCSLAGTGQASSAETPESLPVVDESALLTIATREHMISPWVVDNNVSAGQGFDLDFGLALSNKLGYRDSQTGWVRVADAGLEIPHIANWDMAIGQFMFDEKKEGYIDYTDPYYVPNQAILTQDKGAGAQAKTIADVAKLKIGILKEADTEKHIKHLLNPQHKLEVFENPQAAISAFEDGAIDGIISDVPRVYFLHSKLDQSRLLGQIPDSPTREAGFVVGVPKKSPLKEKINKIIAGLQQDGTIENLVSKWVTNKNLPLLPRY